MKRETEQVTQAIERAARDLVYSSESDRPFEPFFLEGGGDGWPYAASEFARRMSLPNSVIVEERTLHDFFSRHIENTDPYDVETQRIRPRYEALRGLLDSELSGAKVFRAGKIEIRCWIVGADETGNLTGLETIAIET